MEQKIISPSEALRPRLDLHRHLRISGEISVGLRSGVRQLPQRRDYDLRISLSPLDPSPVPEERLLHVLRGRRVRSGRQVDVVARQSGIFGSRLSNAIGRVWSEKRLSTVGVGVSPR